MPRQNEVFHPTEKKWLRQQCLLDDVKEILLDDGNNCLRAANHIWPRYVETFKAAFPEEDVKVFKRRRANARSDRRPHLSRKPAESAAEVAARMSTRLSVSIDIRLSMNSKLTLHSKFVSG